MTLSSTRIKISQILESQIPDFVNDDFPLFKEFLTQYFISLDSVGGAYDLLQNVDRYIDLDTQILAPEKTTLSDSFFIGDTVLRVNSTYGFPNSYGLLKIGDEIITYKSKTDFEFRDCIRGFSGVNQYDKTFVFSKTGPQNHNGGDVINLSWLLLKEFLNKLKNQIAPGFENKDLDPNVNERLFYKQIRDLYISKGSDESFRILFSALFDSKVEIIRPSDSVFEPSATGSRRTVDLVLYPLETDADYADVLLNRTLLQDDPFDNNIAYGTITNVQKILRGDQFYYIVSIDDDYNRDISVSGTIFGQFETTQTTRLTETHKPNLDGSYPETLYVDSTVEFRDSDILDVHLDTGLEQLRYYGKSINELYDVSIANYTIPKGTLISTKKYAYVKLGDDDVYFRITNVISDIISPPGSNFKSGEKIIFNSLGLEDSSVQLNNWRFNSAARYNIETISVLSQNQRKYSIILGDDFDLQINDKFFVKTNLDEEYNVTISSRQSEREYVITSEVTIPDFEISGLNLLPAPSFSKEFYLDRKLNKGNFLFFPETKKFLTDVQNTYKKKTLENDVLVMSSSIPSYSNEKLSTNIKRITFSFNVDSDTFNTEIKVGQDATPIQSERTHSFYTGDAILYKNAFGEDEYDDSSNTFSLKEGIYFVKVIDNKTIKLAESLDNLVNDVYINVTGNAVDITFYYIDFFDISRIIGESNPFQLSSKRLVKNIKDPIDSTEDVETTPGKIGILNNGVEILNYKSKTNLNYGPIQKINVLSGGDGNYDIINPPTLVINDGADADGVNNGGIGATGFFVVEGSIRDIEVIGGGFNYTSPPTVKVYGGNGTECSAKPIMESYAHVIEIDSADGQFVGISSNKIILSEDHLFSNAEEIQYRINGTTEIGGLKNKENYFVGIEDSKTFKLYKNQSDAVSSKNEIEFTDFGSGFSRFESVAKKKKIKNIQIESSSFDFSNRKVKFNSEKSPDIIDFYTNEINIPNHGFNSGELIVYDAVDTPISGLTSNTYYYVNRVSDSSFKLSESNIEGELIEVKKRKFYEARDFVNITDIGSGDQIFKYPEISVSVTPINGENVVDPQLIPIARGYITDVVLEDGGVGYGCTDIFNVIRPPSISAEPGKNASVKPFIINGQIRSVIIQNSGTGYVSQPSIEILTGPDSPGFGAELIPIVNNGILTEVIVKSGGFEYDNSTTINIISSGKNCVLQPEIYKWNVNEVARNFASNQIYSDDGFLYQDPTTSSIDDYSEEYGILQYTALYVPRKLRETIYNRSSVNGRVIFTPDLVKDSLGRETESKYHSPIIGWAYDGNPIYGPYGFANIDGTGGIKRMTSGYKKITLPNRPSVTLYPLGFFVNDYEWNSTRDLDEYNGRFCITPEYPNGVYAYFATIGENTSSFSNYKEPVFPYFIGNKFKSKLIDFNFDSDINQENYTSPDSDFPDLLINANVLRNTTPYNISSIYGSYQSLFNPKYYTQLTSEIQNVTTGELTNIDIISGGKNYQVGDKVIFDDISGPVRPLAKVVSVANTELSQISCATTTIFDVEITPLFGSGIGNYLGVATVPHNLSSGFVKVFDKTRNIDFTADINVIPNELTLSLGIGTPGQTGIVTFIRTYGESYNKFNENDIFSIESNGFKEEIKILNIDSQNGRLRIERNANGTIGTSYSDGQKLYENSRKIILSNFDPIDSKYKGLNKQYYFNPKESVGVGIGTTVSIENPGVGNTSRFIGNERIYIPNGLSVNDQVFYDYDDGPISVESNGNNFTLEKNTKYYAYPFDINHIGLATNPIGVGSTGVVGLGTTNSGKLLTFTDFGAGKNHSIKTNYSNIINAEVLRFEVTVGTAKSHNLVLNDEVNIRCKPNTEKTVDVIYNETFSKFSVGSLSFGASDVNIDDNTITINDHNLKTGETVIHVITGISPADTLVTNTLYTVIVIDSNTIKLVDTEQHFSNLLSVDELLKLASPLNVQAPGKLLPINPPLRLKRNQTLVFDVSDPSLSFTKNNIRFSAFSLEFYTDKQLKNRFLSTKKSNTINVQSNGRLGVDLDATVKLICDDDIPDSLYYNLVPLKDNNVPARYSSIKLDLNVSNIIRFERSDYTGRHKVSEIVDDKTFKYYLQDFGNEGTLFTNDNASIKYGTISTTASGPINKLEFISQGKKLVKIPSIEYIRTRTGTGAILLPKSDNIGIPNNINIPDIGYDFPTDYTLAPRANAPSIFKIESLTTIDYVHVIDPGKNYTILPDLKVLDGLTNKVVSGINLDFVFDNRYKVNIIKSSSNLNDVDPIILPINNSNGYKIKSLTYDSASQDATIVLDTTGFSALSDWPFTNEEEFMIEGVIIQTGNLPKFEQGFNSENYGYRLFEVKTNTPNIGGQDPSFTFSMKDFVGNGAPGFIDDQFTTARVIPKSSFPKFVVDRKKNIFFEDEIVTNGIVEDLVLSHDPDSSAIAIFTSNPEEYKIGQLLTGKTSRSQASILDVVGINTFTYNITPFTKRNIRSFNKKGFLNDDSQRLHDSDYYQYFSYAIKTTVGISSWQESVDSILHPTGFKQFSNLQVESNPSNSEIVGIQTASEFLGIANFSSYYDLNCIPDIDITTENNVNDILSDEIRFNTLILQDYFQSIGNRVLIVDDFSDEFNSNPRATPFSILDTFRLDAYRSKKYVVVTSNRRFPGERQTIIVNVIHNNIYGFLNQYGRVETDSVHGYFDIGFFQENGLLLFYPIESEFTDFSIVGFQYAISSENVGVATQYVGDIASIGIQTVTIPQGTNSAYKIVGIDSSYTSSKIMVTIEKTDEEYYQYDEFNVTHDGISIYETEFSTLNTSTLVADVALGIGTYQFDYSGNEVEMKLVPNSGLTTDYNISATVVSISDTSRVSTGTSTYQTTLTTVGFGSTSAGSATTSIQIMEIDEQYHGFNIYASIEDLTNNIVQFSELVLTNDNTDVSMAEFGVVVSDESLEDTGIGTFTAYINSTSGNTEIYFEPLSVTGASPNREVEVRLLVNALSPVNTGISTIELNYQNGQFNTFHDVYTGTQNDIKRSFELRHKGDLIFERAFDSSSIGTVVGVSENVLNLSNHFFVTGEKVTYSYPVGDEPIGIATTTLSGIGSTDKLPETLYVFKVNNNKISFTDTAENALKFVPDINIELATAGVGTQHKITATNKHAKGLFTIDNMIQTPVKSSGIATSIEDDIAVADTLINTSGITSIFSGDLLKINDEIMLVEDVGIGTLDKIRVRRPWMGTELAAHSSGDIATKLYGNYTIIGSTINFAAAPFGKVPLTVDSNQFGVPFIDPDDRDYTGITTSAFFHGRTFMRSGVVDSSEETYENNYIFDDISSQFTGIRSDFPLTFNGSDISGISTDNAIILVKDIFQQPSRTGISSITGNYSFTENGGATKIIFNPSTMTPGEDVNTSNLPVGGVIISVGSTNGLGYQPCVAAGGTATVSGLGSITNISIGNSGSGYRPGIQTHINVKAVTSSSVSIIGYATALNGNITGVAITNPGTAYTTTNPPEIIFDSPLNYTNIPLIYSDSSVQGIGTKASVDIFVSRDTSIGEFKFNNNGCGYGQGEKLTVAIGGSIGIPTDTSKTFDEFRIDINRTHSDEFSGWSIGQIQQLDSLDDKFDGKKKVFPISFQGERISLRPKIGSNIEVASTLMVFINDILQIPEESYTFKGGSLLIFKEPIPEEYTSRILFYRGTRNIDVVEFDVVEPIEIGDTAQIYSDTISLREKTRSIEDILSSDTVLTNPYRGPGRSLDENFDRPVTICKQTEDLFIFGKEEPKNRKSLDSTINPNTNLIQNVGISSTTNYAWVESVKTFFDNSLENQTDVKLGEIEIISQEVTSVGTATAVVSSAGTISSVIIGDGGSGYTQNPQISIASSGGIVAVASCFTSNGIITSITVNNGGTGYISTQPPNILIEPPFVQKEVIKTVTYEGDFGNIISIANTTVGVGTTAVLLGLHIPSDSYLRNTNVNSGFATGGWSGIETGHYFTSYNSNIVGTYVTSIDNYGQVLSISTSRLNNVLQAADIERKYGDVVGIGSTEILEVTVYLQDGLDFGSALISFDNDSGSITFDSTSTESLFDLDNNGSNDYFGQFSWGKITWDPVRSRRNPIPFTSYHLSGYSGISTSPYVTRVHPLKKTLYTRYQD